MEEKRPLTDASERPGGPRLLDQVRSAIRRRHYSHRTQQAYTHVLNKGGRGVTSPLDSGGSDRPPVARDVTGEYSDSVSPPA